MEHVTWTWRIKKHVVAFFARLPHLPNSLFFHMEDIVEIVLANIDIKKEMEMLQLVRHAGADSAYENAAVF